MRVCTQKLGKMDKDLMDYMVERGRDAERVVKALGYTCDNPAWGSLVAEYIGLLARHSYYIRDDLARMRKDVKFETTR